MFRMISMWLLGGLVTAAGVMHFVATDWYVRIMPPYLPWHRELVLLSGVAEILLGIGLLIPQTRILAAWGMIALFIAVFPANLHMALHPELFPNFDPVMLYGRLPLQLLLIWWAYSFTKRPPIATKAHPIHWDADGAAIPSQPMENPPR